MTFKEWINSLTTPQVMALACQHGNPQWNKNPRRELCSFLIKTDSVKSVFKKEFTDE